ncbi:zinc transporter ZupT [Candidatus Woesearchaeota archaeon]|nr:zinc transporter ZupT [Candidatus Woesearchaeota archaeon]
MAQQLVFAFGLTLFAGLATGIGSMMVFFTKKTNKKFLSLALGFSAGVMVYLSFMEILPKAVDSLSGRYGISAGSWLAVLFFFAGITVMLIIDRLIPSYENPHEIYTVEDMKKCDKSLHRMGLFVALAIAIHNFPEGIATFTIALKDISLGIPMAIAIAIHNIPEGIAISVPYYCGTGNRKKAFFYSFMTGLTEPLGALLAYIVLMRFLNGLVFGIVFAAVAGIMIYVSLDELLPSAQKYGEHHLSIYGLIIGMMVMALSLLLFIQ